jgi:hypothetical protein
LFDLNPRFPLTVALLTVLFTFLPLSVLNASEPLEVSYVDTPVKFRTADELSWEPLTDTSQSIPSEADVLIQDGGAIMTGDGSEATIKANEKSGFTVDLESDTTSTIRLNHGSIKLDVERSEPTTDYTIKAQSAVIGVRGTTFGVSFERESRVNVFVDTGKVSVSAKSASNRVDSGQSATVQNGTKINLSSTIPERLNLTWNYWSLTRQRTVLKRMKQRLNSRINQLQMSDTPPPSLEQLKATQKQVTARLTSLTERYESLESRYETYRRNLRRKREDFIQNRLQSFNEFRQNRIEAMQRMKKNRKRKMEKMRKIRREKMDSMEN